MEQQHYCFLYTGAKEEEIAFEVWDGIAEPMNAGDDGTYEGWYLYDNGDMDTLKPINSTILTHNEWLNRIRPLQVGDVVEHIREGKGVIKRFDDNDGQFLIELEQGYDYWGVPHRLRLISRADKPTEWQPKWGEEVEVSDDGKYWLKNVYVGKHPDKENIMPHVVWLKIDDIIVSYKHIRPIPPKPKTLREEVFDWINKEGCTISCDARIKLSHIIDRHDKGGKNG